MSKTSLGRGLGHLLHGTKPEKAPDQPVLPLSRPEQQQVGPGLGLLLNGVPDQDPGSRPKAVANGASPRPNAHPPALLRWTLLAADGLLMLLVCWLVFSRDRPLTLLEVGLCVLSGTLAACLGCWAFLLWRRA